MSANGLHRIRWRRFAVERIHRTAASQFARDLVNIQQSIVEERWKMSANGLHRIRWRRVAVARVHRTAACQFAKDLVNIQQSIVEEGWKFSANALHRTRWRRVAVARINRTAACLSEDCRRKLLWLDETAHVRQTRDQLGFGHEKLWR